MAKPTTYATPICLLLSVLSLIGIIVGLIDKNALWAIILLIPAVGYEVYRTEGASTKWASWLLLALTVAEIICLAFNIKFNLAAYLGLDYAYVGSTYLPLGELTTVFPMAMAALAIILFVRTNGIYTKWLSVIIFVSMVATVYIISPNGFQELISSVFRTLI